MARRCSKAPEENPTVGDRAAFGGGGQGEAEGAAVGLIGELADETGGVAGGRPVLQRGRPEERWSVVGSERLRHAWVRPGSVGGCSKLGDELGRMAPRAGGGIKMRPLTTPCDL